MATSPRVMLLLFILIIYMVAAPPPAKAVITCDTVYDGVKPCLNYVLFGGIVSTDCCNGLESVIASATTIADHQSTCSCIKSLASQATDDELSRAASIPGQCGATIPFEISPNVDCSKVK
ncbi:non-specific lipid-transfer protein 1-like [Solanum lycopersicum]|uniref:Non-specific lipid-transfer protein n=1 Tax=Solanum lycopersicum TaxID=4081 RepID=A0A3Q7GZ01_SOLLC|nr:non-specific lipid-transfer protein 1-like [Solanum lycopersicum]